MRSIKYLLVLCSLHTSLAFATTNEMLENARNAYGNGDYTQAISIYETINKEGESDNLYYNLGNAYYKNNQNIKIFSECTSPASSKWKI